MQQQQAQMQDQQIQAQKEIEQQRMDLELRKLDLQQYISDSSNETKIQVAEINVYSRQENLDQDNDGIPDMFDTDSDQDGCTDAFEAGTSTSNVATVPGTYGANGFADALETSGNGVYIGTYTYSNAINSSVHTCVIDCVGDALMLPSCDFDGDGSCLINTMWCIVQFRQCL